MARRDARSSSGRRGFLKRLAVAGGAAGAAVAGGAAVATSGEESKPVKATPVAEPKGYRETPHIREYYRLARS